MHVSLHVITCKEMVLTCKEYFGHNLSKPHEFSANFKMFRQLSSISRNSGKILCNLWRELLDLMKKSANICYKSGKSANICEKNAKICRILKTQLDNCVDLEKC